MQRDLSLENGTPKTSWAAIHSSLCHIVIDSEREFNDWTAVVDKDYRQLTRK